MARYLGYFSTVGDAQPVQWEDEEELHVKSEELGSATGQFPTKLTFRDSLRGLYGSERFQVRCSCLLVASDPAVWKQVGWFLNFDDIDVDIWEECQSSV